MPKVRQRFLGERSREIDEDSLEASVCRTLSMVGEIERPPELEGLPICSTPTKHRAGSLAKIEVMRQRVENNFSPFHPDDNPLVELQAVRRYFPEPEGPDPPWD